MARIYSENPNQQFRNLRQSGRARLPVDPIRQRRDSRELLQRGTLGSLDADVRDFEARRSEGREILNGRGYRGLDQKHLAQAGPDTIEKINQMHKQRTGSGGGMSGNAQIAFPKLRDPFEQFREKAWWFLKEGDFSQSLKKVREWSLHRSDTPIQTLAGIEQIKDIKIGEKVLTHRGRYRKVVATWNREDDTTLWSVKPHYVLPFEFTEGHKIWVRRDGKEQWTPIQEITTSDEVFIPVDKTVVDKTNVSVWETLNKDEWIVAEDNYIERQFTHQIPITCIESELPQYSNRVSPTKILDSDIDIRDKAARNIATSIALKDRPIKSGQTLDEVIGITQGRPRNQDQGPCESPAIARGLCQVHYSRRKFDGKLPDISTPSGFSSKGSLVEEMFGKKIKDLTQEEVNAYALEVYHRRRNKGLFEDSLVEPGWIISRNQKNAHYSPLATEYVLDKDLLWLMGMFVAEGSTAEGKKVHWDLNRNETEYAERIKRIVKEKFDVEVHIREKENSKGEWLAVESSNVVLNAWFSKMLGVGHNNKHLPEWMLFLPEDKAAWLLRGYFDGDGCYGTFKSISATTTSEKLAYQIQRLIQRAGFGISMYFDEASERNPNWSNRWTVGPSDTDSPEFASYIGFTNTRTGEKYGHVYGEVVSNGFWVKVKSISSASYKGTVYDLTVEEDFSFVTSVAAHNCRLVYMTHPLVPSLIDIYSRFPLLDIEFKHKDQKLAEFYNDLFLNQLDYQEFLFDMAREYWTVGEAFALGSWHDGIGAWDADELLNPDDVMVSRNSVLRQYQFHLKVPEGIKKLIETRQPREEYEMLVRFYPYILQWAQQNTEIPVSDVLLKQLKFKVNPWEPHGVPILMRAFKTMMLEMSLEAAQDAVADRLYSPLILANLGIEDVGDGEGPWIPEPEEIDALRDDLQVALMSDFRLMVYHHGLSIQSVFGREAMPRFDMDFERVDMKLMQIFGIGPELLQGGNSSAPYASGALNRELLTQMLTTYQVAVKKFLHERMEVVAERQGHFEFEKRGTQRFPIEQTVLVQDEITGEEYIEERAKLAIPDVSFRTMNLRDETVERQFLLELKQAGIPVSDGAFMVNVPIEFDDEVTRIQKEKMDKVLAELHYQKRLFTAIFINHLPVPPEYAQAYMEFVSGIQGMALMMGGTDVTDNPPVPNLFPELQPSAGDLNNAMMVSAEGDQRSDESDEQRGNMPRQASINSRPVSEMQMYASSEQVAQFKELGMAEWLKSKGMDYEAGIELISGISSEKELTEKEDIDSEDGTTVQGARDDVSSGYEWTTEQPESVDLNPESISTRVAQIKSMASPEHMRLRRRMVVPEGTKVREASREELDDQARRWLDAKHGESDNSESGSDEGDGGLEGTGQVLGEDD